MSSHCWLTGTVGGQIYDVTEFFFSSIPELNKNNIVGQFSKCLLLFFNDFLVLDYYIMYWRTKKKKKI